MTILEKWANRDATDLKRHHIHTSYENGITAIWLGQEVFFCVELPDSMSIKMPVCAHDLPRWVIELLDWKSDVFVIVRVPLS